MACVRFLHCKVTLFSCSFHTVLFGEKSLPATHLCGEFGFTFLKVGYLHRLFGIQSGRLTFVLICISHLIFKMEFSNDFKMESLYNLNCHLWPFWVQNYSIPYIPGRLRPQQCSCGSELTLNSLNTLEECVLSILFSFHLFFFAWWVSEELVLDCCSFLSVYRAFNFPLLSAKCFISLQAESDWKTHFSHLGCVLTKQILLRNFFFFWSRWIQKRFLNSLGLSFFLYEIELILIYYYNI